ncbi:IS630 family transposase [Halobellus rubicundus]|uniref:IS630 family transposase n=1 Tax=Halobellus rubicundus TaxID=2996466 RepID=A0ABD5MBB4_9EURY
MEEAARRVGKSKATGSRWLQRWNEDRLGQLTPNFGDGRPPKLGEDEQDELLELPRNGQPWKNQEIQHLLNEEFDVEYHPVYLSELLDNLGLSYSIHGQSAPRVQKMPKRFLTNHSDDPHNKRDGDDEEGWVVDDDICNDGGTVLGFFDTSHPKPWDNSHRVWYVDDPHIERPLVHVHEPAVGFYALDGENVVTFTEDQTKKRICNCLERIREQNSRKRILLVLDNYVAHTCEYTPKRAHQLGIHLVLLPVGSPNLNPIEQVWKQLNGKHRRSSTRARNSAVLSSMTFLNNSPPS